jgi:hypothetical protein
MPFIMAISTKGRIWPFFTAKSSTFVKAFTPDQASHALRLP